LLLLCLPPNHSLLAVFPLKHLRMPLPQLAEWHIEAEITPMKVLDLALDQHRTQYIIAVSGAKERQ
jgi:hypothetical protein